MRVRERIQPPGRLYRLRNRLSRRVAQVEALEHLINLTLLRVGNTLLARLRVTVVFINEATLLQNPNDLLPPLLAAAPPREKRDGFS